MDTTKIVIADNELPLVVRRLVHACRYRYVTLTYRQEFVLSYGPTWARVDVSGFLANDDDGNNSSFLIATNTESTDIAKWEYAEVQYSTLEQIIVKG